MERKMLFLTLMIVAALMLSSSLAVAQDTLMVDWSDGAGNVTVNNLRNVILADTTDAGERAHSVYKLKRGGMYHITDPIQNEEFPLTIVGETFEEYQARTGDSEDYGPAIIQRVAREDGSDPGGQIFKTQHDLALKNIYLMGQTDQGVLANYALMQLQGADKNYVFDNIIFDRNDWFYLEVSGENNDVYVTNCKFRNIHGPTQIWEGRAISFLGSADTVIIENNTFMNLGCFVYQCEAAPANYARINHNTIVNLGRQLISGFLKQVYVTNNVFVNAFWNGESYDQYSDPSREDPHTGIFQIGELPGQYGTNFGRQILLANNSNWRDPSFENWYENPVAPDETSLENPIRSQPFINDTTQDYFDNWDNMVMQNNYLGENPDLTTPVPDSVISKMKQHIVDLYNNEGETTHYFWDDRPSTNIIPPWPLPEDFTYSNSTLLEGGTDDLPLGDLNWYPEKKADFVANKTEYVSNIEEMASAPELEVTSTMQAEDMSLGGDATEYTVEGETYFYMEGSGYIRWNFDLAEAGTYKLVVYTRSQDAVRGQNIIVDGTGLRNNSDYGEWYWDNLPAEGWLATEITEDLLIADVEGDPLQMDAGSHTISIEPSWGWQAFKKVEVVNESGEVVHNLTAPMAEVNMVVPHAPEASWAPEGFKSVILNAGGSVSGDYEADRSGQYMARIYYAADGEQSANVTVNGEEAGSVALSDTGDVFTDYFQFNDGSNTFQISSSAGGVNIDKIEFILNVATVAIDEPQVVKGFELKDNYPNPFNPTTTISFRLPKREHVRLTIYNIMGQKVKTLVNSELTAGNMHRVEWNGTNMSGQKVSSGIYFYKLKAGNIVRTRKMTLLK